MKRLPVMRGRCASGTQLVPREHYQNAASWRSSIFHTAMVLGPAVGGGLIAAGGPRLAYA
ncbi:MAG: Transrane secretion effector, partial [Planctomycetota bacterium]